MARDGACVCLGSSRLIKAKSKLLDDQPPVFLIRKRGLVSRCHGQVELQLALVPDERELFLVCAMPRDPLPIDKLQQL